MLVHATHCAECRPAAYQVVARQSSSVSGRHAPVARLCSGAACSTSLRCTVVGRTALQLCGAASRRRTSGSRIMTVDVRTADATTIGTLPELIPLDGEYESKHAFSELCNWIIPGRLMLGRYPFCEPSRCRSRDQGEAQLQQLLEAGITTFVCLQAELPPQEEMKIGGVGGFLPYKATTQLIAAGMSGPPPMQSLHELRTPDLDKFLPPRRHRNGSIPEGSASGRDSTDPQYNRRQVDFLHYPIVDLGLPTEQQVLNLLPELESRLRNPSSAVYLHCWGGRGRAGTVACCLLGRLYGLSADEALERVQRAFDTRRDEGRPSPETEEQKQFVRDFIANHC